MLCTLPPIRSEASSTVTLVKPFSKRVLVAARPAKPAPITTIRGCRCLCKALLRGSSVLSEDISQLCMPSKLWGRVRWGEAIRVNTKPSSKTNNRDYSQKGGKEHIKDKEHFILYIFHHVVRRNDCNTVPFQVITLNNTNIKIRFLISNLMLRVFISPLQC